MLKTIIYSRVSTEEQDPKGQLQAILDYARARGYNVIDVVEEHISGSVHPLERPGFRQALEKAKSEDAVLLLYDITRFWRAPQPAQVLQLLNQLTRDGILVDFAAETEPDDPLLAELIRFIKAWYATYERQQIRIRTKYGLAKLRTMGRLYHKPGLEHYYAAVLYDKEPGDLTPQELEAAKRQLRAILQRYLAEGTVKKTRLLEELARRELATVYLRFPKAPKNRKALYRLIRELGLEDYLRKNNSRKREKK